MKGFFRVTKHALDPDELLMVIICLIWAWAGWSTWNDLIGKPRDAPFLRIPGEIRSVMWWATAALGVVSLHWPRRSRRRRLATVMLGLMPSLRLFSYIVSWVSSWKFLDDGLPGNFLWGKLPDIAYTGIPDELIKGDPNAWGSAWLYVACLVLVLCEILAPWSWSYLSQKDRKEPPQERSVQ